MRADKPRSKSANAIIVRKKIERSKKIDYTGCKTEEDYVQRQEEFFAPPPDYEYGVYGPVETETSYQAHQTPQELAFGSQGNDTRTRRSSDPCPGAWPTDLLPSPESMATQVSPQAVLSQAVSSQAVSSQEGSSPEASSNAQLRSSTWSSVSSASGSHIPRVVLPPKHKLRQDGIIEAKYETGLADKLKKLLTIEDDELTGILAPSQKAIERRRKLEEEEKERVRKLEEEEKERLRKLEEEQKQKEREEAIEKAKALRLERRFPSQDIVQPLNPHWEQKVADLQNAGPKKVITTTIGGTELFIPEFQKLLGAGSWLNDESINGWIEWVVDAANKSAKAEAEALGQESTTIPKFIAHNSFFFPSLEKKGPESTQGIMRRKKAPGVSLLEIDTVLIPICENSHWTIGVVRPVARTIEYFDSMGGGATGKRFITAMRGWLKFQLGKAYLRKEWTEPKTRCARQNNGWDCGVFVCTNAFCVAKGLDTSCYVEKHMRLQRKRIAAVLINRGFHNDFAWENEGL